MNATILNIFEETLEQHLSDPKFSVAFLADKMDISERVLYRRIKRLTGKTPNQLVRERRMLRARALLQSGDGGSVRAVAAAVGYANPYYFSQFFERFFGEKPILYLKK